MPKPAGDREHHRAIAHLPGIATAPQPRQGFLAFPGGLSPADAERLARPALMVSILKECGALGSPGRGAPILCRIFVEGIMAVMARDRGCRRMAETVIPVRTIAGDWLQWNLKDYKPNKRQYGLKLECAMEHLNRIALPFGKDGKGKWYPVNMRGLSGMGLDDGILIQVEYPTGSDVGAPVDLNVLRALGKNSSTAWRLYLSLCLDWNHYGAIRGRLIRPTRPVAVRDSAGCILDASGMPITKGGTRIKNPYHPDAILTGERETNPARNRYPAYAAQDLILKTYATLPPLGSGPYRKRLYLALKAAETVERAGGCKIEKLGHSGNRLPWRIMPPDPLGKK